MNTETAPYPSTTVESVGTIALLMVYGSIALATLIISPLIVSAAVASLGINDQQAGLLISVDMFGLLLANIPAIFLSNRINWRKTCFIAALMTVLGGLASGLVSSYETLLVCRGITAFGMGILMAAASGIAGMSKEPDRAFAYMIVAQLVYGAIAFPLLPSLMATGGLSAIYLSIAVLGFALFPLLKFIPVRLQPHGNEQVSDQGSMTAKPSKSNYWLIVAGAAAIVSFQAAHFGIWAFVGRIGEIAGFNHHDIGYAEALASFISIAGVMVPIFLATRIGRLQPISLFFILSFVSLGLFLTELSYVTFSVATILIFVCWNSNLPYLFGAMAASGQQNWLPILANLCIFLGLVIGPIVAGTAISGEIFSGAIWSAMVLILLAILLIIPVLLKGK